jgi:alpha-L-fucosidase
MANWFESARFGMFVHWGAYSAPGWEPSWPLVGGSPAFPEGQDFTVARYDECFEQFDPPAGAPAEWVALAQRCGMRYLVLTTKHHDGYTLFPTKHSHRGVGTSLPGRDLVGEYVEAVRAAGLRLGFYFSLSDWHHPDYPAFTDDMRPYQFIAYRRAEPERWQRFVDDQRAQLRHLLTAYGQVDVLWFDGGWERSADEWGSAELESMIRELQPEICINDRLPMVAGYQTPEQVFPADRPDGPWETCMTMNRSWGNVPDEAHRKSAFDLVSVLTEVAARGGNLLLNVSPDGEGRIPDWQRERLETTAAWLDRNGEAVFDTGPGLDPWQFYGPTTARGTSRFLFCPYRPTESVVVRGVHVRRVQHVRVVGRDRPLEHRERLSALDEIFGGDPVGDLVISVPDDAVDPVCTVIEVRFSS